MVFFSFFFKVIMAVSLLWPLASEPDVGDPYIIINTSVNELAYFHAGEKQVEYRIASGKEPGLTPEGEFTVVVKAENPYFRKLDIPGGSPDNPLGTKWIGFDAHATDGRIYGIHGTNQPHLIGEYVSNGCVRLMNDDVDHLFTKVPVGTKIWIGQSSKTLEEIAKEIGVIL
ncbi:L,D-transpeptidase [Thalassorhabdus alkalitolerans]